MDDVQAEAGVALIAAREERVEGIAPDLRAYAAAIVGKTDLNIIIAARLALDVDGAVRFKPWRHPTTAGGAFRRAGLG
jgi:hypothetical protein